MAGTSRRGHGEGAVYRRASDGLWVASLNLGYIDGKRRRKQVYGKTQRKTSTFVAHNENNEAKVGDTVAIAESRPLSRRKRWVVTRVVAKASAV